MRLGWLIELDTGPWDLRLWTVLDVYGSMYGHRLARDLKELAGGLFWERRAEKFGRRFRLYTTLGGLLVCGAGLFFGAGFICLIIGALVRFWK